MCYSDIERGVLNVSLVNIERIAKGLRRKLPDLFSRVEIFCVIPVIPVIPCP